MRVGSWPSCTSDSATELHKRRRATDEDQRPLSRRPRDLRQHRGVDAPSRPCPVLGLVASQRVDHFEASVDRDEGLELSRKITSSSERDE